MHTVYGFVPGGKSRTALKPDGQPTKGQFSGWSVAQNFDTKKP